MVRTVDILYLCYHGQERKKKFNVFDHSKKGRYFMFVLPWLKTLKHEKSHF